MPVKDLTGMICGRLTVVRQSGADAKKRARWECLCSCGNTVTVQSTCLVSGFTRSCGCLKRENSRAQLTTHGKSKGNPTYSTWMRMRQRCKNPKSTQYKWYGGRGITICERWELFENFLLDMGDRPKGKTIDRIDHNGNYEPENCKWSTHAEQGNNTSRNHYLTYGGKTQTIADWSRETGIKSATLVRRINVSKWTTESALTIPTKKEEKS